MDLKSKIRARVAILKRSKNNTALRVSDSPKNNISFKVSKLRISLAMERRINQFSASFLSFGNRRRQSIIGVDITPSCIYLCKIDGINGKRVLTSMTSVCMEGKFLNEDIVNSSEDYVDSLKELIKENNIRSKNVALSIPVSNSIVRMVTIPRMTDEEIKKALKFGSLWNNFMNVDKNPDDYSIFYQVLRRKRNSDTMDVLLVATKLSDIRVYTEIARKSGLNPVIVDARCFAISNAFRHKIGNNEKNGPNVFIEFGLEESYAMIIDGDRANIYEIAINDTHRAAIIDKALDNAAIDDFIACYTGQLQKIISSYEQVYETGSIKNIFVLSEVALIKTIVDKLSVTLDKYNLAECNFFDCMKISDDFTIAARCAKQNLSSWSAAIGAALRRLEKKCGRGRVVRYGTHYYLPVSRQQMRQIKMKKVANIFSAAAAFLLIAFVISTQMELRGQGDALSAQLAKLDGIQEAYNEQASANKKLEVAANTIEYIDELKHEINQRQGNLMAVYQYLNLVILDDVWLREISFSAPDKIEIVGGASEDKSIVEFMSLLNQGNNFAEVSLRGMSEIREQDWSANTQMVKTFKFDGTIANLPVRDPRENNLMAGDVNHGT